MMCVCVGDDTDSPCSVSGSRSIDCGSGRFVLARRPPTANPVSKCVGPDRVSVLTLVYCTHA